MNTFTALIEIHHYDGPWVVVVVVVRYLSEHQFVLTNRVRTVRRTREDEDRERHRNCLRGAASTETVRARAPGPAAERSCSTLSRRHVAWRREVVAVAIRSGATEVKGHTSPIAIQGRHSDSHGCVREGAVRHAIESIVVAHRRTRRQTSKGRGRMLHSNGRHVTRVMSRCGLRSVRLGEASRPGPVSPAALVRLKSGLSEGNPCDSGRHAHAAEPT